ncbi:HAD family hydrolase [Longitalea luteola]|uniref:HAD family hydrolase n=1 Tax=Longitalea luteola TaxID=2812563 RepID=UPI001A95BEE2|nr:HAD hydrolase-like protein [Longitalea luteola]
MSKFKAFIFDLDGTIANTLPLCIQAFRKAISPLAQRTITDEEIVATFGPSEEGTISALVPDQYDQALSSYLVHYEQLHHQCSRPFEGMAESLEELRNNNVRLAMVTGKGPRSTEISLRQFGLGACFEYVKTGSAAGPIKHQCIDTLLSYWTDIKKEQVIYVGDAPSDIVACRLVGIPIAAAAWAPTARPEALLPLAPDFIFYDVKTFRDWAISVI